MYQLNGEERSLLLGIARQSVEAAVCGGSMRDLQALGDTLPAALKRPAGAFVTLHQTDELRGCVGFIHAERPLYETVVEAGAGAALHDTRFLPISCNDVPSLEIEISVLSEFREARLEDIHIGTHGLMVTRGLNRGLLLPQVPVEHGWNAERFLQETCRKADLAAGAWRDAKVEIFSAEVFSERD